MKKINLFIISLVFFSSSIFFVKEYFFWVSENELNNQVESIYIEPSIIDKEYINISPFSDKKNENKIKDENIKVSLKSAYNIDYVFYPKIFEREINDYITPFKIFLNNKSIISKIDNLKLEFHKDKSDVRWKMKNRTIKLYWIKKMKNNECTAVWIHEFGHFVDLYFLKKWVITDISNFFYNISWESTMVMKPWLKQSDFVSGYSMTNKYEDFAESFTYFVLHNEDFLTKSNKSKLLKDKYNFFIRYLFRNWEFVWTDFSTDNQIKNYYRDITKINFSLENFLEFLKK